MYYNQKSTYATKTQKMYAQHKWVGNKMYAGNRTTDYNVLINKILVS